MCECGFVYLWKYGYACLLKRCSVYLLKCGFVDLCGCGFVYLWKYGSMETFVCEFVYLWFYGNVRL